MIGGFHSVSDLLKHFLKLKIQDFLFRQCSSSKDVIINKAFIFKNPLLHLT